MPAPKNTANATPVSVEPVNTESAYYEVNLNRKVSYYGHDYKPGVRHVVDEPTLALLGDAVAEKKKLGA